MPLTSGGPSNFDTLLTTTLQKRNEDIVDNIHRATPTLMFFDMKGTKRTYVGGESILQPLLYARHGGLQRIQGYGIVPLAA